MKTLSRREVLRDAAAASIAASFATQGWLHLAEAATSAGPGFGPARRATYLALTEAASSFNDGILDRVDTRVVRSRFAEIYSSKFNEKQRVVVDTILDVLEQKPANRVFSQRSALANRNLLFDLMARRSRNEADYEKRIRGRVAQSGPPVQGKDAFEELVIASSPPSGSASPAYETDPATLSARGREFPSGAEDVPSPADSPESEARFLAGTAIAMAALPVLSRQGGGL